MKSYLLAAITVAVLALTGVTCSLLLTVRATVKALPVELARQGDLLRVQSLAEIDLQATALQKSANAQLTVIRKDTVAQAAAFAGIADRQLTGARSDLKQTVAESVKTVVAPLEGLRSDLQPVIAKAGVLTANAGSLTQDLKDSLDDIYPDTRSLVESAEVTMTAGAQAAEVIRDATPVFVDQAKEAEKSFQGIAADAHTASTEFVKPKTFWQGFKSWLLVLGRVGAAFI